MEVKQRKAVYREVFNWHEKRLEALAACPASGMDDFWKETCESICDVSNRLGNHPFAMDALNAVFKDLERRAAALNE